MRSNTLMPLLQFIEFFGIEPFYAAGIDKTGDSVYNYPNQKTEKCFCMLEEPWMQASNWSRQDLIAMVRYAEQVFTWETNMYPNTTQIEAERIRYRLTDNLNPFRNKSGNLVSVRLQNPCGFQQTGKITLEYLGLIEVDKTLVGGELPDEFEVTFQIPYGLTKDRIKLYFTQSDAGYVVDPTFEDREYEIRPLRNIVITADSCTVTVPAYLFKKPSLENSETCLPHDTATYVDEVLAFYTVVDECEQGYFVCKNDGCLGGNCDETIYPICFQTKQVGHETWLVPKNVSCDENGLMTHHNTCPTCRPSEVLVNYLSGINPLPSGDVQYGVSQILSKLAIGLADCVRKWCDCDACAENKVQYYRQIPRIATLEGSSSRSYGNEYRELVSPQTVSLLSGYPPYLGITMALREMAQYKCYNVEGSSL